MCNQRESNSRPPLLNTQRCRSIKKWSEEADANLQDCFAPQTGICSGIPPNGIEDYTTSVTGFINKCIDDDVPTVTVHTYPNQKPWITGSIRTELMARAATFKEWDSNQEAYKKYRYALRRTIKQANTMLVGCGRACKPLQTTNGSTAESCPVTRAYQTS